MIRLIASMRVVVYSKPDTLCDILFFFSSRRRHTRLQGDWSSDVCSSDLQLREAGHADTIQRKTGLLIDAYFSGTKLRWILDNVNGARAAAERGELAFGTVDSWLIWQLTGGRRHVTDVSNASRTDRKSTRLNSSHLVISYAVFCLKKQ